MAYSWMRTERSTFLALAMASKSSLNFSPERKEIISVFFSPSIGNKGKLKFGLCQEKKRKIEQILF